MAAPLPVPGLPVRPALRPGLQVVRRDDGHLQVGIDAPERVILADDPDVRRTLEDLRVGRTPTPGTPAAVRCLTALVKADLVVDAVELAAARSASPSSAALYARFGTGARHRIVARAGARTALDASGEAHEILTRLLRSCGCEVVSRDAAASLRLVARDHEIPREEIDPLVRDGMPHLLVTGGAGGITVGPFVVPGLTACLRCVDAHLAESDPRRPLVVEQVAHLGVGASWRDPVLQALALAWAVRDVASFVDGDEPATWSTSVRFGSDPAPVQQRWTRHPHCGCSWGDALA